MNYQEALTYIHNTYKFGAKLGTENIRRLLNRLGNPDKELKIIHIAGTNGKGSTSNMIHDVLMECGYKTGLFISPYLEEFTERIQINKVQIDREKLAEITELVKGEIDKMVSEGYNHPSEFEVVTAIGLVYFSREKVDFVVLEVGLGGRLDATNGIDSSLISVITSISYDHTEYLGDTLEKIASEKAGIIKAGNQVVIYPQGKNVVDVIVEEAKLKNSEVHLVNKEDVRLVRESISGQEVEYLNRSVFNLGVFKLALLGEHQRYNCITALKALEILKSMGYNITEAAIVKGLGNCRFPGRFEIVRENPVVILDGGHNIDGVAAFTKAVKEYFGSKKITLVYGMLKDKHPDQVVDMLIEVSKEIYTLTPNNPRAMKAEELAGLINEKNKGVRATALNQMEEALSIVDKAKSEDVIACVGSLYLIGDLRKLL